MLVVEVHHQQLLCMKYLFDKQRVNNNVNGNGDVGGGDDGNANNDSDDIHTKEEI